MKRLTWSSVKLVARSLGMHAAVKIIEDKLSLVGGSADTTWEDIRETASLLEIESIVGILESSIVTRIRAYRIANSQSMKTADKITALTLLGYERKEIAEMLGVRYQQVRNVQVRTA